MKSKKIIRSIQSIIEALEARIAPATFIWNNGASGNWSDATKWYNQDVLAPNNGVPDDFNDIAMFDNGSGSPTVTLDNSFTIQQLDFNGSGTTPQIVPNILGSSFTLNFERVGSAAVISNLGGGRPVISAKVNASAGFGVDINVGAGNTLVFNGPLTESSGYFNKIGVGTATFGGAAQNTFNNSHGLQVTAGTLNLSKDAGAVQMGGNINILGGTVVVTQDPTTGNEEIGESSTVTVSGSGVFRIAAPVGETVGSLVGNGVIDLAGNRLSVVNTSTFAGTFSSDGTIGGITTDQRLDLSGTQVAVRNLTVSGRVRMLPGSNFSSTNFTLQLNTGNQTILDGDGTLGNVSGGTLAGDTFLTPGSLGVGGKLSVASLAPGGSNLDLGFTVVGTGGAGLANGHDQIVVRPGGAVNLTGGSLSKNFTTFTPAVGQTFTLIDNQFAGRSIPKLPIR